MQRLTKLYRKIPKLIELQKRLRRRYILQKLRDV